MNKRERILEVLLDRADYLMDKLPKLEESMELTEELLKRGLEKKRVNIDTALRAYTKVVLAYHQSLELLRKILVYFGPELSDDQVLILKLWNQLSEEDRKLLESELKSRIGAHGSDSPDS